MVPITDSDMANLERLKAECVTLKAMAERTGYSPGALAKWLTGGEYEMEWRQDVKRKINRLANSRAKTPDAIISKVFATVHAGRTKHPLWEAYRQATCLVSVTKGEASVLASRLRGELASMILADEL